MNVVITGASRGIGKSIASIFATNGHNLFLVARNEHHLLQAAEELQTAHPRIKIKTHAFDLSKKEDAQLCGEWLLYNVETIDVLVNNAGTFTPGNISDEPEGALENMLSVNLFSAYHVTRAVLPKMIKAKSGHIFTVCSIAGLQAYPNGGAYSISKFALLGFTKNLRHELKEKNIKVTAIIPGAVYTDSWKGSGVSEDRIMEANDIATLVYQSTQLSTAATIEEIIIRPQLGDL